MRPKTISHSGPRSIYELGDRFRPSHRVLRVTATGIATEPACREMYASLSHFAETGGPYAVVRYDRNYKQSTIHRNHPGCGKKPPAVPAGRPGVLVESRPAGYGLARMFEMWRDGMGGQL